MFLRASKRLKDGKEHVYWSIVENKRVAGGKVVQRHVLYLGEINDSQREAWRKTIEIFEDGRPHPRTVAHFAQERIAPTPEESIVRIRLDGLELHRPRQWGACWMACQLYEQLGLDQFWSERLPPSRKGTRWDLVLQALCAYRLIDPGSEWRFHRQWFEQSAMADLLGSDFSLAEGHRIYEVHDHLLAHKQALFSHLQQRWRDLFNAKFEVLLYDLTSTYFESDPPFPEGDKRKFGYSRDKRSDCVQVVIALIVTPEGFPMAYEVLAGNTSDKTTLRAFLKRIEAHMLMLRAPRYAPFGLPAALCLAASAAARLIAFLAYCLQVTLQRRLRDLAPGLTVRSVLEKFAAVSMVDVHLPTTDGRTVIMPRYTQPEKDLKMLLKSLKIELPAQPRPRITANGKLAQ